MQKIGKTRVWDEYDTEIFIMLIILIIPFKSVDKLHIHLFHLRGSQVTILVLYMVENWKEIEKDTLQLNFGSKDCKGI